MNRLYQWFSGRASLFSPGKAGEGARHTIRTEVTVERESTTLITGVAGDFGVCPLCGQTLDPAQAQPATLRLQAGSADKD